MLDLRYDSIVYQSQVYVSALVDQLITDKKLGKALDSQWAKVDLILAYLEALENKDTLQEDSDITNITFILECLIILCEIASLPTAPTLLWNGTPSILVGVPGANGLPGPAGSTGPAGLATDFHITNVSITAIVDSFPIGNAKAARWDYFVSNGTAQRASSILGHWTSDGSLVELTDTGAEDLGGATGGIEFDIVYSGGNIQLIATVTSGTWTIVGSRYFIPNNGNGSGPISGLLPYGNIFIGNISNVATAQVVSGAITLSPTGVASLGNGVITDVNVSASAGITTTKLAPLTPSRAVVTNNFGYLVSSLVTDLQLGYVGDVVSPIQAQINLKLTDPLLAVGDILIRNASNITARLGIGTTNQVLTSLGGVPTWSTAPGGISGLTVGYIPKANSGTTVTNSIISETTGAITVAGTTEVQGGVRTGATGPYYKWVTLQLGDWNMLTTSTKAVPHGIDFTKIRMVDVFVRDDSNTNTYSLFHRDQLDLTIASTPSVTAAAQGRIVNIDATNINLERGSYFFISTNFDATSYNRGWLTIMYEA